MHLKGSPVNRKGGQAGRGVGPGLLENVTSEAETGLLQITAVMGRELGSPRAAGFSRGADT